MLTEVLNICLGNCQELNGKVVSEDGTKIRDRIIELGNSSNHRNLEHNKMGAHQCK